ncbi:MAG: glycosyltransferase family 39 protein [Thermodesulfobacteriota bacterium]|nr:glycosyltransferase family 39 protein [Thermodesulfobacteriota bacterium]
MMSSLISGKNRHQLRITLSAVVLIALSLMIRLHDLDRESLYMDELKQVSYYTHSFIDIIRLAATQQQPPLDYWIGHFVAGISTSDFAVRLPSVFFGTGMIVFYFLLISRYCAWRVAFGFAAIMSLLPYQLYYSQEARPYAIALFFLMALFWSLDRFFTRPGINFSTCLLTFLFCAGFLFSRTLSPFLVVLTTLFLISAGYVYLKTTDKSEKSAAFRRRLIPVAIIFATCLAMYLPFFLNILFRSDRYTIGKAATINLLNIFVGVKNFSLIPLRKALVVQTEPLTMIIGLLVLLSCFAIRKYKPAPVFTLILILLPCVAIAHVFIFTAKTNWPFRPAYAIYLLPFTFILAAIAFEAVQQWLSRRDLPACVKIAPTAILILMVMVTVNATLNFKQTSRKNDWRGLAAYLSAAYDENNIILFDSLSAYGEWEPTFMGFPRYYEGSSRLLPLSQIPSAAPKMVQSSLEPVLVLYQWREISLTHESRYPVFPLPETNKTVDYKSISGNPSIKTKNFLGFLVIEPKRPAPNLAAGALEICEKLLAMLPNDDSVIDIELSRCALQDALIAQKRNNDESPQSVQ